MRKTLGKLLLSTLGAFGLLACDTTSGPAPTPEYACPYVDYMLTGTVIDADSSKAIEGIEIRFIDLTAYSDADGNWQIAGRQTVGIPHDSLFAADIDGESNRGSFLPDSLLLNPTLKEPVGPHSEWYLGTFEQTGIVITLEKNP